MDGTPSSKLQHHCCLSHSAHWNVNSYFAALCLTPTNSSNHRQRKPRILTICNHREKPEGLLYNTERVTVSNIPFSVRPDTGRKQNTGKSCRIKSKTGILTSNMANCFCFPRGVTRLIASLGVIRTYGFASLMLGMKPSWICVVQSSKLNNTGDCV